MSMSVKESVKEAPTVAASRRGNHNGVAGILAGIFKDYIPILAIVIGGIWYLSTEINQRPTKKEVGEIVQAKLDKFELTLLKKELYPIREDVIKIRSDVEYLIKAVQLGMPEKEITSKK